MNSPRNKAQSTLEFTALFILVCAGLILTGPYVIRGVNALMKSTEDSVHDSLNDPLRAPSENPTLDCGDGVCEGSESTTTCCYDCGSCGDGVCCPDHGENLVSCSQDCSVCGDGQCTGPETITTCCKDCSAPNDGTCCLSDADGGAVAKATILANISAYEGKNPVGKDAVNGNTDCPQVHYCGNGYCNSDEDTCTCCQDCGTSPTDGCCNSPNQDCGENSNNDCKECAFCGNHDCETPCENDKTSPKYCPGDCVNNPCALQPSCASYGSDFAACCDRSDCCKPAWVTGGGGYCGCVSKDWECFASDDHPLGSCTAVGSYFCRCVP